MFLGQDDLFRPEPLNQFQTPWNGIKWFVDIYQHFELDFPESAQSLVDQKFVSFMQKVDSNTLHHPNVFGTLLVLIVLKAIVSPQDTVWAKNLLEKDMIQSSFPILHNLLNAILNKSFRAFIVEHI